MLAEQASGGAERARCGASLSALHFVHSVSERVTELVARASEAYHSETAL